jgi:PST family polysaccharide transporter
LTAPADPAEIRRDARLALKWSLGAQLLARAGSFLLGLVLARLLEPAEYGTYAIALGVFLILLTVDDLGMLKGLVRWPGAFEDAAPTVRTLGTCIGVAVYGLSVLLAPVIADVTSTPAATGVIRLLCVGLILDAGLQIVPTASLQRRFRQDLWIVAELAHMVVMALVTIWLASAGYGVWSLPWGSLAGQCALAATTMALARVPVRYRFDRAVAAEIIRSSAPWAGAALIAATLLNVDYLVIGRTLGPAAVGVYLVAFNVSGWPTSLVGAAVRAVSIPGFSQLRQSGDDVGRAMRKGLTLLVAGALPYVALLISVPTLIIGTLYGDRWVGGAPALQFLALMSVVRLIDGLTDDALFASGHSTWIMFKNLFWLMLLIVALSIGAHIDGIRGVAIAQAIVACGAILPLICGLLMRAGMWSPRLVVTIAALVPAAAIAGALGWLVSRHVHGPRLVVLAITGAVEVFGYAVMLVPFRRRLLERT